MSIFQGTDRTTKQPCRIDHEVSHRPARIANWVIRHIVADIGSWFSGARVLLSPDWISDIDWSERRIVVDVSRDQVERSPKYELAMTVDIFAEQNLYRHYGQTVYWE